MRVSKSRRKRLDFFDKLRKTLSRWVEKTMDILGKPIEIFDRWIDRYERGFYDGVDAAYECEEKVISDILKTRNKVIKERCNHIEAVISEMELNYPELHTEVDSIEKSLQEIRRQVR